MRQKKEAKKIFRDWKGRTQSSEAARGILNVWTFGKGQQKKFFGWVSRFFGKRTWGGRIEEIKAF